jgi:hypothetical protein
MNDAPLQTVLQQRDARPVSGEHLEVLGKKAAADWVMGKFASLNDAVVSTIRGERLSPEQVCRVVEFTNGDAYLREFRKTANHKVIHFDCGPASPSQVLQDLNDGGGGSLTDRGTLDYAMPPSMAKRASAERGTTSLEKTAAATDLPALPKTASRYEQHLWEMLGGGQETPIPYEEPLRPLIDLRHKLAGARDTLSSDLDALEVDYANVCNRLYGQVKQASLDGTSLGDIVNAWSTVTTDPVYVKVAFRMLTPRFQRERLFESLDSIGASLQKRASRGTVNPEHELVLTYQEFVDTLSKLASLRALRDDFGAGAEETETLLKQGGGVIGAARKGLSLASKGIDAAAVPLAHVLVGPKDAKRVAPMLAKGTKAVGLVGAGLAGNAAVQNVTDRPAVQGGLHAVKSIVPGTADYQNRRYRNMTGQ